MTIAAEKYFPFDRVANVLTKWGKEIEWQRDGISWRTSFGSSEMAFVPGDFTTLDGVHIAGHIETRHVLLGDNQESITPYGAALWNKYATLSALLPPTENHPAMVLARVSIFEGDSAAIHRLYTPIMVTEAYMQPMLFAAVAEGNSAQGPEYFNLTKAHDEPPYGEEDFRSVQEMCQSQGLCASAGSKAATVEFPWDLGAVSAALPLVEYDDNVDGRLSRTSLCKISTAQSHPHLGRGLLATLQLPLGFEDSEEIARIVTRLNEFEATSVDMPPFMGAWCIGPRETVSFAMFVPNELCFPGLPRNIVMWMGHRARRVPRRFEYSEAA